MVTGSLKHNQLKTLSLESVYVFDAVNKCIFRRSSYCPGLISLLKERFPSKEQVFCVHAGFSENKCCNVAGGGYTIALKLPCRTGLRLDLGSAAIAAWPTQASDRASSVRYEAGSASNNKFAFI